MRNADYTKTTDRYNYYDEDFKKLQINKSVDLHRSYLQMRQNQINQLNINILMKMRERN